MGGIYALESDKHVSIATHKRKNSLIGIFHYDSSNLSYLDEHIKCNMCHNLIIGSTETTRAIRTHLVRNHLEKGQMRYTTSGIDDQILQNFILGKTSVCPGCKNGDKFELGQQAKHLISHIDFENKNELSSVCSGEYKPLDLAQVYTYNATIAKVGTIFYLKGVVTCRENIKKAFCNIDNREFHDGRSISDLCRTVRKHMIRHLWNNALSSCGNNKISYKAVAGQEQNENVIKDFMNNQTSAEKCPFCLFKNIASKNKASHMCRHVDFKQIEDVSSLTFEELPKTKKQKTIMNIASILN